MFWVSIVFRTSPPAASLRMGLTTDFFRKKKNWFCHFGKTPIAPKMMPKQNGFMSCWQTQQKVHHIVAASYFDCFGEPLRKTSMPPKFGRTMRMKNHFAIFICYHIIMIVYINKHTWYHIWFQLSTCPHCCVGFLFFGWGVRVRATVCSVVQSKLLVDCWFAAHTATNKSIEHANCIV